jgi:hypothetical protein
VAIIEPDENQFCNEALHGAIPRYLLLKIKICANWVVNLCTIGENNYC